MKEVAIFPKAKLAQLAVSPLTGGSKPHLRPLAPGSCRDEVPRHHGRPGNALIILRELRFVGGNAAKRLSKVKDNCLRGATRSDSDVGQPWQEAWHAVGKVGGAKPAHRPLDSFSNDSRWVKQEVESLMACPKHWKVLFDFFNPWRLVDSQNNSVPEGE